MIDYAVVGKINPYSAFTFGLVLKKRGRKIQAAGRKIEHIFMKLI